MVHALRKFKGCWFEFRHGAMCQRQKNKKIETHLLFATRHGCFYFLRNHFLLLTVSDLLGGRCDCFLFKLLCFGICAQIFVGRCSTSGNCCGSHIRAWCIAWHISLRDGWLMIYDNTKYKVFMSTCVELGIRGQISNRQHWQGRKIKKKANSY